MKITAQVAIEYLLMITVSIVVVAAVLNFMQDQTTTTTEVAEERIDEALCMSYYCGDKRFADEWCQSNVKAPKCGGSAECGTEGFCVPVY